jgi:hypothetical protein
MEHLLYSGLMFAAGMLSVWAALLLTLAFVALGPEPRKSSSRAATISSTTGRDSLARVRTNLRSTYGAEESTPARSLSQTVS